MVINQKNIWILGGTGFIGSALTKHLLENPGNRLHVLLHRNNPVRILESSNTFFGNLQTFDFTWMEKYPPDIIFHLARLGGRNSVMRYIASHQGAEANQRLIKYVLGLHLPPRVIYVSGSLMYGHQVNGKWADEYSDLSPVSYARQYIAGERPWIEAQIKQLLDIRFARPGWIVGPDSWFKVFYWNYYKKSRKVPLYGEGNQMMSIVDVDDCAGQIAGLAENGKACQNINIFSGLPVSQKIFATTLAEILHAEIEHIPIKRLKLRFGRAAAEAFESSIPLKTLFPEFSVFYKNRHSDIDAILRKTISLLKHK